MPEAFPKVRLEWRLLNRFGMPTKADVFASRARVLVSKGYGFGRRITVRGSMRLLRSPTSIRTFQGDSKVFRALDVGLGHFLACHDALANVR